MTYSAHPSSFGLTPSLPPSSSRQLLSYPEEDESEPESLDLPHSSRPTPPSNRPGSRTSSAAGTRLTKRPRPPTIPTNPPPNKSRLHKHRASSASSVFTGLPSRSMFKSHPDHLNAEEIRHIIDPTFYSSLTPSSTPPSASRLSDHYDSNYLSQTPSSSHPPEWSKPYTDAEGQLHDPDFRMFDIEIAPHARRARASRSSSAATMSAGASFSGLSIPGPGYDYGPAGRPVRLVPLSSSSSRGRGMSKASYDGRRASYDPLLGDAMRSLPSWDEPIDGEPGYESPDYDSESGMDPRDMIETHVEAARTDSGYAGTISPNSPPAPTALAGGVSRSVSSNALRDENGGVIAREEAEFRREPRKAPSAAPRRPHRNDVPSFGSPYSPSRPSSTLQVPIITTVASSDQTITTLSSRRDSSGTDNAAGGSGSGSRTPYKPQPSRELSRSTLYPRPVDDNTSFPSQTSMARTASQPLPRIISPPQKPDSVSSLSEPSDDGFAYDLRPRDNQKRHSAQEVPVMGAPEGYVEDPDSPFRPIIVEPIDEPGSKHSKKKHPSSKGVVPGHVFSTSSSYLDRSRAPSPAPGFRDDKAHDNGVARGRTKRDEIKNEGWGTDRPYQPSASASKKKTRRAKSRIGDGDENVSSEKYATDRPSLHAPNGAPYWYADEPRSVVVEEVDGLTRTSSEKPHITVVAPSSSLGTGEARSIGVRGQRHYVPSHHGKSVSIRPGVPVIDDDYAPGCTDGLRRSWQSFKLSLRFGAFRTRKRIERKVASLKS